MPRNGLPESIASSTGSTSSRRRSSAIASSNAPTPGSTTLPAAATWAGSLVTIGLVPDLLEPLLHAAKVAHAVVDDGDHGRSSRE